MNDYLFQPIGNQILAGNPLIALDIGACNGMLPHWTRLHGNARFYLFEPHEQSFNEVVQMYANSPIRPHMKFFKTALSETGGKRQFFRYNTPSGSSFHEPNHSDDAIKGNPYFYPLKEEFVETQTLTQVLDSEQQPTVDAIKLDVQGAEIEILRGLDSARMNEVLLVELEVSARIKKTGFTNFVDTESYLPPLGFQLMDLRVNRVLRNVPGRNESYNKAVFGVTDTSVTIAQAVNEFDCIYFRKPETLIEKRDAIKLRKLIFLLSTYNFFPDAMYTLEKALEATIFTPAEAETIKSGIMQGFDVNRASIGFYQQVVDACEQRQWAQYMWQPYPST